MHMRVVLVGDLDEVTAGELVSEGGAWVVLRCSQAEARIAGALYDCEVVLVETGPHLRAARAAAEIAALRELLAGATSEVTRACLQEALEEAEERALGGQLRQCDRCPHPAHRGTCNARSGATAYRCACTRERETPRSTT